MMGSKKKHEHSKSRKKHKHKKHKKKKEKTNVSDVSDAQEIGEFEATASTEEALEQYDQILLALQTKKDEFKNDATWKSETAADVNVSTAQSKQMDAQDASTLSEQPSHIKETDKQPCSDGSNPSGNENMESQSNEDSQSKGSQILDKSRTTETQSSSQDHKSKSKNHQSKGRSCHSSSRDHRKSRDRRSRSRDHRSRSRDSHLRSRDHRSRNRGHHRSHRSKSRDHHTRKRYSRSSSREHSRSRGRHYSHRRRWGRSSSSSSWSGRSRSPRRKPKLIIEKAEPQLGSLESFTTLCQQLATAQETPVVNFPIDDNGSTIAEQQTRAPFNIGTANTQSRVT